MADAISLHRCKRTKETREKKGTEERILEGISDFKRCRGELKNTKDFLVGNGIQFKYNVLPQLEKTRGKCARGAPKEGGHYQFASLQKDEREKRKERGGEWGFRRDIRF